MDENYIDIVRKSLYGSQVEKRKPAQKMPRKEKKIKFAIDHYSSETVFRKDKSDKVKQRNSTPFKRKEPKKRKSVTIQSNDSSFEEDTTRKPTATSQKIKNRKATPSKTTPKKRKLVITFSSDSLDEDVKDNLLSPSRSEMELFQNSFKKSNNQSNPIKVSSDSEESVNPFDLNEFFNTYEPSLNESITETHSGIDNEFESEYVGNVNNITNIDSCETSDEEARDEVKENKNVILLSDSETNDMSGDVAEVTTKMQEAIVLDDEEGSPIVVTESPDEDIECLGEYTTVDCYDLEDCMVVVLKENQSVSIYGLLILEVLYGKLDVFGQTVDKTSAGINLYSPRGSALLQIINITTENTEESNISDIIAHLALIEVSATNKCAIIKCTKLDDTRIPFIEKYISQQIFPKLDNTNVPQAIFQPTGNWSVIKENYAWNEILSNVRTSTKLVLAGGKGAGKSTLLRYAINKLLSVFNKIRVIDLDPGQAEFTVPGCVSIVTVTDPVFGPNYTHLKSADRSFLCNINVGHDPRAYIKCVQSLMLYYNTLEECPTLINYMGFVQGIGLNIISSALTYIQPTDIIQIQSKYSRKNFVTDLTYSVIQENCNLFPSDSAILEYNLHKVHAMNDDNEGWSLEPRQSREMCVLAYLGQMIHGNVNSLTSHRLPMYEIKLSCIKIANPDGEDISPAAINANLVALCYLEQNSDLFVCLGYGIVRGIDLESETLVLLTPEAPSTLEETSHLVLGNVNLPPSVYMTPDEVNGNIPYVMQGELISLGHITKRTYLPTNKK